MFQTFHIGVLWFGACFSWTFLSKKTKFEERKKKQHKHTHTVFMLVFINFLVQVSQKSPLNFYMLLFVFVLWHILSLESLNLTMCTLWTACLHFGSQIFSSVPPTIKQRVTLPSGADLSTNSANCILWETAVKTVFIGSQSRI